jgi:enterochelin esterase-like enzyme
MQAGIAEDPDLLRCNRELWERADRAGLDLVHVEHPGGHELSAWRHALGQALPHLLTDSG